MPLTVTHGNGKAQTFDDSVELITFGRKMGSSVEFPANETAVSSEHFGIRRQMGSGAYVYEIANGKPVFLNGKEIYDGAQAGKDDRVTLGKKKGPALRIAATAVRGGNMPVTDDIKTGGGGSLVRPVERAERSLGFFAGVIGAMALATAGLFFFVRTVDVRQVSLQSGLEKMAQQSEAALKETRDGVPGLTDDAFTSLATMQRKVVYQVAIRLKTGEIKDQATAFAILDRQSRPILVTNGHVAELADLAKQNGVELIAVSAGGETIVKIAGAKTHPGYTEFEKFAASYAKLADKDLARPMRFAPAYDVAFLIPEDPSAIRFTAELAPQSVLDTLEAGQTVTYAGFPSEELIGTDATKPEPTAQRGTITAMTGYLMARRAGEPNYLIQSSLPMAGGASGSPIFDVKGRVVGVANAGNVNVLAIPLIGMRRMPSAALINYGQRADLIAQLLDDRAGETWVEDLRSHLSAFQASLMKSAADDLLYREADWKQMPEASGATLIAEATAQEMNGSITLKASQQPAANFDFKVRPGRKYVLFAATPDHLLSFTVLDRNGAVVSSNAAASQVLGTQIDTGLPAAERTLTAWIYAEEVAPTAAGKPTPVLTRVAIYEVK
jgi:S1-C subfamily serine protease